MRLIVEFSGKILVHVNGKDLTECEDVALYTLGQLTGDELLAAISDTSVREVLPGELKEMAHATHKADDYL